MLKHYTLGTASILALCLNSVAWAQTDQISQANENITLLTDDDPTDLDFDYDEITVTGTRLLGGPVKSEPVSTITSDEIRIRGIENVDQLLRQISSNNTSVSSTNTGAINGLASRNRQGVISNLEGGSVADLRGIGAGSTLVLLNGRRLAGEGGSGGDFADISGIPIDSIERVDVLTAGASAIYGSDAVAGVINIILKKNYTEKSVRFHAGFSESGADDLSIGVTSGFDLDSGNLTLTGTYQKQKAVDARKFGVTTLDFRNQGGSDRRELTSTQGVFLQFPGAFGTPRGDIFLENGLVLPTGSSAVTAATDIASFNVVPRDQLREVLPVSLAPEFTLLAGSARYDQDVNYGAVGNIFVDASFSVRETDTEVEAPLINVSPFEFANVPGGVPFPTLSPFPFPPFRSDIQYSFDTSELVEAGILTNQRFDTQSNNLNLEAGLRGDFAKNWGWEASVAFSQDRNFNVVEGANFGRLINGVFDPTTFTNTGAINLIRNDFLTNTDLAQTLTNAQTLREFDSQTDLLTFQGFTRGRFFTNRPAGAMSVVLGSEYRQEEIDNEDREITTEGSTITTPNLYASRDTFALFGEVSFPLNEDFVVNVAARYEDVKNAGTSVTQEDALAAFVASGGFNQPQPIDQLSDYKQSDSGFSPRLGASWQVTKDLLLRGTIGQSFRAPNANEVGRASSVLQQFTFLGPTIDPQSGLALDPIDTPQVSGGNPNLKSEIADTMNLGAEYNFHIGSSKEGVKNNFGIEANYYTIDYKDRISSSFNFLADQFSNPPSPLREPAVVRNSDGSAAFTFNGPINIGEQAIAGYDFTLRHNLEVSDFGWSNSLNYSKQTKNKRRAISTDEFEDILNENIPQTRWNFRSSAQKGDFSVTGLVRYTGSFESFSGNEIDSLTTADANITYNFSDGNKVTEGLRLTVGATNIFDIDPQFVDSGNGFSTNSYDLRRRVFYVDFNKRF